MTMMPAITTCAVMVNKTRAFPPQPNFLYRSQISHKARFDACTLVRVYCDNALIRSRRRRGVTRDYAAQPHQEF